MKLAILTFVTVALASLGCLGQTPFLGLKAGASTKAEAERVLGQPVKEFSPTLAEYRPQSASGRIFVQYRENGVIERIELMCMTETTTCDDVLVGNAIRLPFQEDAVKYDGDKWRLLYGSSHLLGTSGSVTEGSRTRTPSRIVFYSRELYDAELDEINQKNEAAYKKGGSLFFVAGILNGKTVKIPGPEYPAIARTAKAGGIVRVAVSADENGVILGAQAAEGHPLLRLAAEKAAMKARVTPTLIAGKPVRVVGTLTYEFTPDGAAVSGALSSDPVNATTQRAPGLTSLWSAINPNSSLNGTNLTYYPGSTVESCMSDCDRNPKCRGFALIRAGFYNASDPPMCYLVATVTSATDSKCCLSAVKK
jgi:hypothetical protein